MNFIKFPIYSITVPFVLAAFFSAKGTVFAFPEEMKFLFIDREVITYSNGKTSRDPDIIAAKEKLEAAVDLLFADEHANLININAKILRAARKFTSLIGVKVRTVPSTEKSGRVPFDALEIVPTRDSDLGRLALAMDQASQPPRERVESPDPDAFPEHRAGLIYDPMYMEQISPYGVFIRSSNRIYMKASFLIQGKISTNEAGMHELVHFSDDKDSKFFRKQPYLGEAWYSSDSKGTPTEPDKYDLYSEYWCFDEMLAFQQSVKTAFKTGNFKLAMLRNDRLISITLQTQGVLKSMLNSDPSELKIKKTGGRWFLHFQRRIARGRYLNAEIPIPEARGRELSIEAVSELAQAQLQALRGAVRESLGFQARAQMQISERQKAIQEAAKRAPSMNEILEELARLDVLPPREKQKQEVASRPFLSLLAALRGSKGNWYFSKSGSVLVFRDESLPDPRWKSIRIESLAGDPLAWNQKGIERALETLLSRFQDRLASAPKVGMGSAHCAEIFGK